MLDITFSELLLRLGVARDATRCRLSSRRQQGLEHIPPVFSCQYSSTLPGIFQPLLYSHSTCAHSSPQHGWSQIHFVWCILHNRSNVLTLNVICKFAHRSPRMDSDSPQPSIRTQIQSLCACSNWRSPPPPAMTPSNLSGIALAK